MAQKTLMKKFKMPPGCNAREFVMRETNGFDEQAAALQADARGERTSIYQEMIRLSIVEVDGEKVIQPYVEFETWNTKSRSLIQTAYAQMNEMPQADLVDFLKGGEVVGESDAVVVPASPAESAPPQREVRSIAK